MAGNTFGTIFTATTFGESHGPALGCVVDGCPAGLALDAACIRGELARRRPGSGPASTTRVEADEPEILSGVFEGRTLGSPIAIIIRNTSPRPADYDALKDRYRPGHADWAWEAKYGFRDHRGGGRSSGRETVGRVAAGAVAKAFLAHEGVAIRSWVHAIAGIEAPAFEAAGFDLAEAEQNEFRVPCRKTAERIREQVQTLRAGGDSAGGLVACRVTGLPPGLGEPVFDKLDARIAGAMLSIGAVKGVEFGAGFAAAASSGSQNNDALLPALPDDTGPPAQPSPGAVPRVRFLTNHAGGLLGGLSSGAPLAFSVAFKPVPSIRQPQQTVDRGGAARELIIEGRHDICICPRAVPVVEAMAALVLADLMLLRRGNRV
jgi:chorismate synthase